MCMHVHMNKHYTECMYNSMANNNVKVLYDYVGAATLVSYSTMDCA